ncbi:murein L,D-transpeptidase catalytic domain family protein [Terrimonas alba]|uniref:murein L,D-transpeptidase catalytic domain family protein n=1 Tax=Terrimonas alba TaxID=3349636 RepID=UPI0035F2FD4B
MKTPVTISICCLLFALFSLSWLSLPKNNSLEIVPVTSGLPVDLKPLADEMASLYFLLNLHEMGLSQPVFEYAYKGYNHLVKKKIISKQNYLTICDFSQSSNNKRLYVVDLAKKEVLLNTYVAHGRNSGGEYATRFSNKLRSLQSSLGFYITQNTYYGEHGLSLRMRGLETGYNDKAVRRRIVIHGADYIGDDWLRQNPYMGRSYGCPAIPRKESNYLINTIKNGSCLFIYHPSKRYMKESKILNG